jgi:outer membrane lipoprotein-sorting protein
MYFADKRYLVISIGTALMWLGFQEWYPAGTKTSVFMGRNNHSLSDNYKFTCKIPDIILLFFQRNP